MKKLKEKRQLLIASAVLGTFYGVLAWLGKGCPIKYLTGISCAGCGMTRAWCSVLRFDFHAAFNFHPLFWMIPLAGVFYVFRERIEEKWKKRICYSAVVIFLTVYILRMINSQDTVVCAELDKGILCRIIKELREIRL